MVNDESKNHSRRRAHIYLKHEVLASLVAATPSDSTVTATIEQILTTWIADHLDGR